MTDDLKQFLTANKELFMRNNFNEIFKKIDAITLKTELLEFLFNTVHINPLNYMDVLPSGFFSRTVIPTIEVPSNINSIKYNGISECEASAIIIKSGNTKLEDGAIRNLNNLATMNFPEGMVTIPKSICENCRTLSRVNLPVSVKRIKPYCFTNTPENLKIVTPYRENKADKLTIPSEEIDFYKAHLRFTHAPKEVNDEV